MTAIPKASAVDIVTQLVTGPSLQEVASKTLRDALKTLYPNLDIDPRLAMVVQPTWAIVDGRVVPDGYQAGSLTNALVRLGLSGTTVTYLDGEHYLTLQPGMPAPAHLPVKIDAIGLLLNELAPLLFIAYKEQHVEYWDEFTYPGQPRWQQLSEALRNLWNVDASVGWDADEIAMARAIFKQPDPQQRLAPAPYSAKAYLIDLDRGSSDKSSHLTLVDAAVVIGTIADRKLILTHAVTQGFQRFDSLEELGEALLRIYGASASGEDLKWRLVEPQGNFFDQQACTLISMEADALGEISFFQDSPGKRVYPHTGTAGKPAQPTPRLEAHFERLQPMLPDWLNDALPMDQTRYSRHLLDLTTLQHENNGKSFQSEITSLQAFTRAALIKQILKEQPGAKDVNIDNIEITITSLVVWGTFVLPGNTQAQTWTLTELALQNLAGLPLGNKTVRYKDGSPVPEWMSATFLEKLVSTVDIGKTYPAHLKAMLLDDPVQAPLLQGLYTSQLRIELPLLALQHKIRGRAGLDESGYRYVVAAFATTGAERYVDGEEIVIRPLAFVAHRSRSTADTVDNMYVIGPRDADKGPCVLYRPLFDKTLLQYPGPANLLFAIQHSRHLRDSVLAWLPDDVRFNYSQFVFTARLPSVWTIPQLMINPTTALDMSGAVALGTQVIASDVLATLHERNVKALVTQADRQSVSDAEARWASLKQGGWVMLNAALPFLGRSVGTAAWIWQIMDDLQEITDGANEQSGKIAWTAIADILLALGMVLAHRAAVGDAPSTPVATELEEDPATTRPAARIVKALRQPDITGPQLTQFHGTSIDSITALKRSPTALATLLDGFEVGKPKALGAATREGAYRDLYAQADKWYARVGERWFEVARNVHGDVHIVDTRQPTRPAGPRLAYTANGQWVIDLRLRLRGGGLEDGRKVAQGKKNQEVAVLSEQITAFDLTMESKGSLLDTERNSLRDAPAQAREQALAQYLATLDSQHNEYAANIQLIKTLNCKQSIPNYRTVMPERLDMQLFLGQEWLSNNASDYQQRVLRVQAILDDELRGESQAVTSAFEQLNDATQTIIEKMESAEACLDELTRLGPDGLEIKQKYNISLAPYPLDDLKTLQISLGQYTCIKPGDSTAHVEAQQALASLFEDAALNVQSSRDLSADESLSDLRIRIDALSQVSEQFASVDKRFDDLASEYSEHIHTERLRQLQARVAAFKDSADNRLADLLRYRHLLVPQAGPSRPATSASNRQIIKTRNKGTLVGQRKKSLDGKNTDLVEVGTALTRVIATFKEESPGIWVEQNARPAPLPKARPNLNKSISEGQALIDGLAAFHRRIEARLKRGSRIPVEVEEEYHNHATLLRKACAAIDEALTASNLTAALHEPSEELNHKLDAAATTLEQKGTSTRIRLVKQQLPTAAGVEWLKDKGEVSISKTLTRRRLRRHQNDFLDEYQIRDAHTDKVLCYAHFHYSSVDAPVAAFVRGHMKTLAQHRMGGVAEITGVDNQRLIEIHRSEISTRSAETLFFNLSKPAADATAPL
ncbi:dermonecrotic toxin domain-containing protein [Pseudomonas sp. S2_A05]